MTKVKPILTLLLGALFVGAILAYSFTQPFQPDAVYSAIPEGATFVYKADNLDELLNSPVCGQLDKALGDSLKAIAASNDWATLAAASEIAVADLPFRSAGQQKTWAAISWVGWRSPWLPPRFGPGCLARGWRSVCRDETRRWGDHRP